jgi:hypothetical protein
VYDSHVMLPIAAIVGMAIYGSCAIFKKWRIDHTDVAPLIVAGFSGMGVASGFHLMHCSFAPECLLHVTKRDG